MTCKTHLRASARANSAAPPARASERGRSTAASLSRADLAQRIASLLLVREANHQALRVARAGFNPPPRPAELTLTYRGPFGPIGIDADSEWLRELLPDFSPRSRRGRRIRRLLRLSEEHHRSMWAEREASGVGALIRGTQIASKANWRPWRKRRAASEAIALPTRLCGRFSASARQE